MTNQGVRFRLPLTSGSCHDINTQVAGVSSRLQPTFPLG